MSRLVLAAFLPFLTLGCASQAADPLSPSGSLASFEDEEAFLAFYESQKKADRQRGGDVMYDVAVPSPPPPPAVATPTAQAEAMVVTGAKVSDDAITNTQVAGVDEGGMLGIQAGEQLKLRGRRSEIGGGRVETLPIIVDDPPAIADVMLVRLDQRFVDIAFIQLRIAD